MRELGRESLRSPDLSLSSRRGREELEREDGRSFLVLEDESESRRGRALSSRRGCGELERRSEVREDAELFLPRVRDSLLSPRGERDSRFCVERGFSLRPDRGESSRRGREDPERDKGRSALARDGESESRRERGLDVARRDEVLDPPLASATLEPLPVDVERSVDRRESLLPEDGRVLRVDDRRELDCDDLDDFDCVALRGREEFSRIMLLK